MERKQLAPVAREFKAVSDQPGFITGYGSVFNVVDLHNDVVAPGAFSETMARCRTKGKMPAMLWQHNPENPIGMWTDMHEDSVGLKCTGQLLLSIPQAQTAYELVKAGAIDGLSIGFTTIERMWNSETAIRTLNKVDLWETSLVTFSACDPARIQTVKSSLPAGDIKPSVLEDALRDAGLSRSEAKAVLAHGFKALAPLREAVVAGSMNGLLDALKGTRSNFSR